MSRKRTKKSEFELVPGTRIEVCWHALTALKTKCGAYHARLREPGHAPIYVKVVSLEEVRPALIKAAHRTHPRRVIEKLPMVSQPTWPTLVNSCAVGENRKRRAQRERERAAA